MIASGSFCVLSFAATVVFKAWNFFEYNFVIAPSLQVADFSGRVWFIVDHDIRIVSEVTQCVNPIEVFFHRAIEVSQAVHHADVRLSSKPFCKVAELLLQERGVANVDGCRSQLGNEIKVAFLADIYLVEHVAVFGIVVEKRGEFPYFHR